MTNQITGNCKGCKYTQVPLSIIKNSISTKENCSETNVTANSRHCDCVNQRIASDSKEQVITVQEPSSSHMTTSVEAYAATWLQQGLVTG
jgi:hypothetical protein